MHEVNLSHSFHKKEFQHLFLKKTQEEFFFNTVYFFEGEESITSSCNSDCLKSRKNACTMFLRLKQVNEVADTKRYPGTKFDAMSLLQVL
jgi:hypothetical protein